jgi:hypothetical protein
MRVHIIINMYIVCDGTGPGFSQYKQRSCQSVVTEQGGGGTTYINSHAKGVGGGGQRIMHRIYGGCSNVPNATVQKNANGS